MSTIAVQQPAQPGTPRPPTYSQDAAYLLAAHRKAAWMAQHLGAMASMAVRDEQARRQPGKAHHDAMVLASYLEEVPLPPGAAA